MKECPLNKYTKNFLEENKLITTIEGQSLGAGKSHLMRKMMRERSEDTDKKIVICDVKDLLEMTSDDFSGKIIGLDEVYLYMDSKFSIAAMNRLFCDMIISSHRGADFYICTRDFDCLDKRIRRAVDFRVICNGSNKDKFYFICKDLRNDKDYSGTLTEEELVDGGDLLGIKKSIGAVRI